MQFTITSHKDVIVFVTASQNLGIESIIYCKKAVIPSPILAIIKGIPFAIPSIIAPIAVVTDFAPSSLVPSNCKKALDNANKPSDAKAIPAPTPIVARPNKVKEPAKAVIEGITGVNTAAAIPNVAKVPAKATNDFINPSQEIVLKLNIGGTNKFSAAETAITAATPPKQPFIKCIA